MRSSVSQKSPKRERGDSVDTTNRPANKRANIGCDKDAITSAEYNPEHRASPKTESNAEVTETHSSLLLPSFASSDTATDTFGPGTAAQVGATFKQWHATTQSMHSQVLQYIKSLEAATQQSRPQTPDHEALISQQRQQIDELECRVRELEGRCQTANPRLPLMYKRSQDVQLEWVQLAATIGGLVQHKLLLSKSLTIAAGAVKKEFERIVPKGMLEIEDYGVQFQQAWRQWVLTAYIWRVVFNHVFGYGVGCKGEASGAGGALTPGEMHEGNLTKAWAYYSDAIKGARDLRKMRQANKIRLSITKHVLQNRNPGDRVSRFMNAANETRDALRKFIAGGNDDDKRNIFAQDIRVILSDAAHIYDSMICSEAVWSIPDLLEPAQMDMMEFKPKLMTEYKGENVPRAGDDVDERYVALVVSPLVLTYGQCQGGFENLGEDDWYKGTVIAQSEVITLPLEDNDD